MTAHIHAALMAEYAKDALETETPWERWEAGRDGYPWRNLSQHPDWNPVNLYRRKPVALCQVEGRDVFPGDKLWHVEFGWVIAAKGANNPTLLFILGNSVVSLRNLSWTEPPKTKTVYQWAMRQGDRWFCSATMVADKVEMVANFPNFTDFRRLDYTALEVPA